MKAVIEKLTKANFYVKIREDTKPMRQPSDDGRVNITKGNRLAVSHYCYDKGAGIPSGYSVAIRCQGGNQSVRYKCGSTGHSSASNIEMHKINFSDLCICTRTLAGNLSLRSVISNMSRFIIKSGHGEQGMKHKSCFYNFL